jgi:hypothetical protein
MRRANRSAETLLEQFDPVAEVEVRSARHQQMNMVRHENVPTHSSAMFVPPALDKGEERRMDIGPCQPRFSSMGAKADEVNRGVPIGIKHRQ